MNRLFEPGPDGTRRLLGIPVDLHGLTRSQARLRALEPENPSLLVPRAFGVGWDLNIGALAARLGLIRPDDSLPDLEGHIPGSVSRALTVGPIGGAAAVAVLGALVGRGGEPLPATWDLAFRPTGWVSAPRACAMPVALSAGAAAWSTVESLRHRGTSHSRGPDVTSAAQALGLKAMSAVLLLAAAHARRSPDRTSLLALAGVVALPAVSTAVLVVTVRSALTALADELR